MSEKKYIVIESTGDDEPWYGRDLGWMGFFALMCVLGFLFGYYVVG